MSELISPRRAPTVSVVIPAYNAASTLRACLEAVRRSEHGPLEYIVVDDGSVDDTLKIAGDCGARMTRLPVRGGPAAARNQGARAATGEVVLFVDSDVLVRPDTIARTAAAFRDDPELDAFMGSYDDAPGAPGFVTHFEGLHHHFTHQNAREDTPGLAGFCSAARRDVFLAAGGFDERYTHASIEDVELGRRLARAGKKVRLVRAVQVKHLKRWTLWGLVHTEVVHRAIPWTKMMLETRSLGNDLNVGSSQRASAGLVAWLGTCAILGCVLPQLTWLWLALGGAALAAFVTLNRDFYAFLWARRGPWFVARAVPMHMLYFTYAGVGFVLGVASHIANRATASVRDGAASSQVR